MGDETVWSSLEKAALAIVSAEGVRVLDDSQRFAARLGDRVQGAALQIRTLSLALADSAQLRAAAHPAERSAKADQLSERLQRVHGLRADLARMAAGLVDRLVHGDEGAVPERNTANALPPRMAVDVPATAQGIAVPDPAIAAGIAAAMSRPETAGGARRSGRIMLLAAGVTAIGVLVANYGELMPFSVGNWVSPEDSITALIMGVIVAAPVAFAAGAGFRGAALVGGLFQASVFLIAALVAGDGVQTVSLAIAKALAFALAPATAAELVRLVLWRKHRAWPALAAAGAVHAVGAGLGTYVLLLNLGTEAFGGEGHGLNVFQIGGALLGGALVGLVAALLHRAASRFLQLQS